VRTVATAAPEATTPFSAASLLPDVRDSVFAIAAAVDKVLNTVSARVDRVQVHIALPGGDNAEMADSGCGANPAEGTAGDGKQPPTEGACVLCRMDCVKVVDTTDRGDADGATPAAEGGGGAFAMSTTQVEKSVYWDGLTVAVSARCQCRECQAVEERDSTVQEDDDSGETDGQGDRFFACEEGSEGAPMPVATGVNVLNGTAGSRGFAGKVVLAFLWAPVASGGALLAATARVTSDAGALVALSTGDLAEVLEVAAGVHALVSRYSNDRAEVAARPLTASVLESLRPVQGLQEVVELAAEQYDRCVPADTCWSALFSCCSCE
jgi:hypothetical protein